MCVVLQASLSTNQNATPQHKLVTNLLSSKVTSSITSEERRLITETSRAVGVYTPVIKKGKDKKTRAAMKKD